MALFSKIHTILHISWKDLKYNVKHLRLRNASESLQEVEYSDLRMYCHMLDKGINNSSFEPGHSVKVLEKARYLSDKLRPIYGADREFRWIDDVIERFEKSQINGVPELRNSLPHEYDEQEITEYTSFIKRRTSCRNFLQKPIPEDVIRKIIDIAVDAPNGCCRQVVRYYYSQDKALIDDITPRIDGLTNFTNVQCLVCVAAETSFYDLVDRNLRFIDASLSVENFLLGASLYGIYGTICNFFHARKADISYCRKRIGIKETEDIVFFMAIGYPVTIPEKPARRDLEVFFKKV